MGQGHIGDDGERTDRDVLRRVHFELGGLLEEVFRGLVHQFILIIVLSISLIKLQLSVLSHG